MFSRTKICSKQPFQGCVWPEEATRRPQTWLDKLETRNYKPGASDINADWGDGEIIMR